MLEQIESFVSLSPKVAQFYQMWVPPCFWAFQGIIPPKGRHLRDVKYKTVTQQLGTGSEDPATNWNFKVDVKCVPTWDAARAQARSLPSNRKHRGPQEAPQPLLPGLTASVPGTCVTVSDNWDLNVSFDFASLKWKTRSGWGRDVGEACFVDP